MSKKRVRLSDIAETAGVSVMAVSHVLNGTGMGRVRVAAERADEIRRVAAELEYTPHHAARALRGSSIKMIGALSYGAMDPVCVRAFAYLQHAAADHGYHVMTMPLDARDDWERSIRAMLSYGVSALIVVSESDDDVVNAVELGQVEGVAVIPLRLDGGSVPNIGIRADIEEGQRLALEYLSSHCDELFVYGEERDVIWNRAIQQQTDYELNHVIGADLSKVQMSPTAGVLCSTDRIAAELMRHHPKVETGYKIIGWGNAAACEYLHPKLSSVGLNLPEVMEAAMEQIVEPEQCSELKINPLLILREST